MTIPAPEDPELWQSRLLLRWLGHPEPVQPQRLDPPEPDVSVKLGEQLIGIEVTRIVPDGQEARTAEGAREAILVGAEREHSARGGAPVMVHVFWSEGFWPTKAEIPETAVLLTDLVAGNTPEPLQAVELDRTLEAAPDLPKGIDGVKITGLPGPPSGWFSPGFKFVGPVAHTDVSEAFSRKNPKPQNYATSYDELWLLIVLGADGPSTWGALSPMLVDKVFDSTFHRAFVFSRLQLDFQELRVNGAGAT